MNRILIVGASSVLGSNLAMALRDDHCVYGTYRSTPFRIKRVPMLHVDVMKEKSLFDVLTSVRPNTVYYCAAVRDERQCTEGALQALTVNAEIAADIALCLRPTGGRLVYFSSSKVFSGQKGNYNEGDVPDPTSSYGSAKVRAEELLADFSNTFILRIGTLFGFGPRPGEALLTKMLRQFWGGKQASFISDEYRTFQSVTDVVEASKRLLHCETEKAGLYHCPGGGRASYFEFARHLAKAVGLSGDAIHPTAGETLNVPFNTPDIRGRDTTLNSDRFKRALGPLGTSLEDSFLSLKNQLYSGQI